MDLESDADDSNWKLDDRNWESDEHTNIRWESDNNNWESDEHTNTNIRWESDNSNWESDEHTNIHWESDNNNWESDEHTNTNIRWESDNSNWESDNSNKPEQVFQQILNCSSFSKYRNPDLESGNKVILPRSCFDRIISLGLETPWLFQIQPCNSDILSHCGVLEFEAEEGFVHMPDWMMRNLDIEEGYRVTLQNANVPKGSYIKLQPHTTSFVQLPDPREILEQNLSCFSCLSTGDTFMIRHDNKEYNINVLEVRPGPDAICLIDTDCNLEFATPLDYKEPEPEPEKKVIKKKVETGEEKNSGKEDTGFKAFKGKPRLLSENSKAASGTEVCDEEAKKEKSNSSVDENKEAKEDNNCGKLDKDFKPFTGKSRLLNENSSTVVYEEQGKQKKSSIDDDDNKEEKEESYVSPVCKSHLILRRIMTCIGSIASLPCTLCRLFFHKN